MSSDKNIINDELHGVLLAADTGIKESSNTLLLTGIILGIAISVILSTGFFNDLFKVDLSSFQNWGFYILIPFATLFTSTGLSIILEKKAYLKYRNDILAIAKKSGYSKYKLITIIEGYKQFENISKSLKKDIKIDKEWQ